MTVIKQKQAMHACMHAFQQLILDDLTKYSPKIKGIKSSSKMGSISIECHLIRATLKC